MKKVKLLILILSLSASASVSRAGSDALSKRLYKGDRAPWDGVLYNEPGVRELDLQLIEGSLCERRLEESGCHDGESPGTKILFFLAGAASSYMVFSFLKR